MDGADRFEFEPGQFISVVAEDDRGKPQTRAYSMASAPCGSSFDLCLDRVLGGFFSNRLCDLQPGQRIEFHGPHGMFLLRKPFADSIFIAMETGVAPIRGIIHDLFEPARLEQDKIQDKQFWLIQGGRTGTELYYREYFARLAEMHSNFRYLPTLTDVDPSWHGQTGHVHQVARTVALELDRLRPEPQSFHRCAYICGLNEMVSRSRETLKELGWGRKQIIFERYD